MGRGWIRRGALLLGGALTLWAPAEARCEAFEVIVVRGASVSRVTGSQDGEIREVVLREDPHPAPVPAPAARAPKPAPEPRAAVSVCVVPNDTSGYPLLVAGSHFGSHGFRRHGGKPYPRARSHAHSIRRTHPMHSRARHTARLNTRPW